MGKAEGPRAPGSSGPFVTPAEAAARLRLHKRTVYRLLEQGVIPGVKIGKLWRIAEQDLTVEALSPRRSP